MDQLSGDIDFAAVFTDKIIRLSWTWTWHSNKTEALQAIKKVTIVLKKERIDGTLAFNGKEIFLMNRIAFRLFKLRVPRLLFSDFMRDLKQIQDGKFEASLNLYHKLGMKTEEKIQQVKSKFYVQQRSKLS